MLLVTPPVPVGHQDVFVSYAWVDNQPPPGVEVGWVTTLVEYLRTQLPGKLRRAEKLSVWMDHRNLAGNASVTPELRTVLRNTTTLLVICSQGYLDSPWCRQERQSFLEAVGGQPG